MGTAPRSKNPNKKNHSVKTAASGPRGEERLDEQRAFDIDQALGQLWHHIARLDALAQSANQALEFLPHGGDRETRRTTERLHALVAATAEAAAEALDAVDEQMERLQAALAKTWQRKERKELEEQSETGEAPA